jgi:imidazolonepropionase
LKASDKAIFDLKKNNVIATLLPATLFNLKSKEYQRARFMIDEADVAVALATDFNPGSCYCENIFVTMHIACQYNGMYPEEVIVASTLNGAYAMGLNKSCGSIEKGKLADILIIEAPDYRFIPYHFGINPVKTTIKRGKIV